MGVKRRWLTREIVVQTAADMADEAGDARAVTLTAVAQALDVRTPSLYNHVRGIDDLRHAMAVAAVKELSDTLQEETVGLVGREALMAVANAYRSFAQQHRGIYGLTTVAPDPDDAELMAAASKLLHFLLLLMASLGVEGDDALHAVRGLRALLHGFVSLESAEGYKMALDRDESFRRLVLTYLDGLALMGQA